MVLSNNKDVGASLRRFSDRTISKIQRGFYEIKNETFRKYKMKKSSKRCFLKK